MSLFLGVILLLFPTVFTARCSQQGNSWVNYKDEKCFKLEKTYANYEEAVAICASMNAEVLTIKSAHEQEFITEFVFDNSSVAIDIWLDASRRGNTLEFQWNSDSTLINYSNWKPGFPTNNPEETCVLVTNHLSKKQLKAPGDGKWEDASCLRPNYVVCQALQIVSIENLVKIVFDNRRRIEELISDAA